MGSVSSPGNAGFEANHGSLGSYAYAAVRKHFKKTIQHEADVLADAETEPLHQMRVGMRRLRTTLNAYDQVLVMPDEASENSVKKLARILGKVRDLDVLMDKLETQYRPRLDDREQKRLDEVLKTLRKRRRKDFSNLQDRLSGKSYQQLVSAYKAWLKTPVYGELAECPIQLVLPDLLLPLVSQLMLHPGWLVGQTLASDTTDAKTLSHWLDAEGAVLHSLRKQIKQVRYQAEFFADFYGETFAARVREFKEMQELLGQLQDCWVLAQVLESIQGKDWADDLPHMLDLLQRERAELWQRWHPIQHQYLNPVFRNDLRQLMLMPENLELPILDSSDSIVTQRGPATPSPVQAKAPSTRSDMKGTNPTQSPSPSEQAKLSASKKPKPQPSASSRQKSQNSPAADSSSSSTKNGHSSPG